MSGKSENTSAVDRVFFPRDVTSACIKLLSVGMTSILHIYIKSIVSRYDVRETEQERISCVLIANQNRAGDTNV